MSSECHELVLGKLLDWMEVQPFGGCLHVFHYSFFFPPFYSSLCSPSVAFLLLPYPLRIQPPICLSIFSELPNRSGTNHAQVSTLPSLERILPEAQKQASGFSLKRARTRLLEALLVGVWGLSWMTWLAQGDWEDDESFILTGAGLSMVGGVLYFSQCLSPLFHTHAPHWAKAVEECSLDLWGLCCFPDPGWHSARGFALMCPC